MHHEEIIRLYKLRAAKLLYKKCRGKIITGPYQGLQLPPPNQKWLGFNENDLASILMGQYELPIVKIMQETTPLKNFIQFGSGFGLNVVGMCYSGKAINAKGFEIESELNSLAEKFASLNGVRNAEFLGAITKDIILENAPNWNTSDTLILCDIEGLEFSLFDDQVMKAIRKSTVIIEVHEFPSNGIATNELMKRAQKYFNVEVIDHFTRELRRVPLLDYLHDDIRFLFLSESRPMLMNYFVMRPRLTSH